MSVTLNSNALVTLADVRQAFGLGTLETQDDDFISNLINRYSTRIENYCGRTFRAGLFTEFLDGDGERGELLVENPPIILVSGVWDDPGGYGANDSTNYSADTLVSSDLYATEFKEGIIRLASPEDSFQNGIQNLKVIYSGGYAEIPDDVQEACIELIAGTYRKYKDKLMGLSSKSSAGGSIVPDSKSMSDSVKNALSNYRRITF